MKQAVKWVLYLLLLMLILLVTAGIIFATFDWNRVRPRINNLVSEASGRHFAIAGDLTVDWTRNTTAAEGWRQYLPLPVIEARDVTLGNPDWAEHNNMANVGAMRFGIELLPLLDRQIVLRDLSLQQAAVALERADAKRNSWTFERPDKAVDEDTGKPWRLALSELRVSEGTLAYRDIPLKLSLDTEVATLETPEESQNPEMPYVMQVTFNGRYREADLRGAGKVGALLALRDTSVRYPLQLDISSGKVQAKAEGMLGNLYEHPEIELDVRLEAPSMAMLYPVTGIVLPNTAPFKTDGRLTGTLDPEHALWRYEDFHGTVGKSDLHGSLTYSGGAERPKLSGTMRSKLLQFADLGPLIGVGGQAADPAAADSESRKGSTRTNRDPNKVLPDQPFKTDRWRAMDVDIDFAGQRIVRDGALPLENIRTHAVLNDGVLTLEPLAFGVAGGELTATVSLDGRKTPMAGRLVAQISRIQLPKLFPTVEAMQESAGRIDGAVALIGHGNSIAKLLSDSGGEIKLYLRSGRISRFLLEAASLNVASAIVAKLFGDSEVRIQCAGASLALKDGLATVRDARIATDSTMIDISGAVDFREERLALDIKPETNELRILSLRTPLYINGTFKHPDIGVEKGPLILRAAAAIGLIAAAPPLAALLPLTVPGADEKADCGALLAEARKRPTTHPDTSEPIDDKTQTGARPHPEAKPAAPIGTTRNLNADAGPAFPDDNLNADAGPARSRPQQPGEGAWRNTQTFGSGGTGPKSTLRAR